MQAEGGKNLISACSGNSELQLRRFDTLTSKICSFERNRWDVRGGKWEEKTKESASFMHIASSRPHTRKATKWKDSLVENFNLHTTRCCF